MVLWLILHGSFVLGIGARGVFSAEAFLAAHAAAARWQAARQWGVFLSWRPCWYRWSILTDPTVCCSCMTSAKWTSSVRYENGCALFRRYAPFELGCLSVLSIDDSRLRFRRALGPADRARHMALHHRRHQDLLGILGPAIVAEASALNGLPPENRTARAVLDRLFASFAPPRQPESPVRRLNPLAATGLAAIRIDALRPPPLTTPDADWRPCVRHIPARPTLSEGVLKATNCGY